MTGRQLALIRGMWGATLLARPTLVLPLLGEPAEAGIGADVLRVLGARHVAQAALTAAAPTPTVLTLGAAADLLHAASAFGFARVDRGHRRAGRRDAVLAATFAGLSVLTGKG
jgi:hypothetical protein